MYGRGSEGLCTVPTHDQSSVAGAVVRGSHSPWRVRVARSDVPVMVERTERREGAVKELKAALESFLRRATHGKVRTNNMLKAGGSKARAQERKVTKREVNAVMERPARGTIETVPTGEVMTWR